MTADDRSDFSRKSGSDNGGEKPKIEVEVVRYRWLFDIIERPMPTIHPNGCQTKITRNILTARGPLTSMS